ncbi:MAG: hypothetical protein JWM56_518, partial [Candidatus Peribacteria bacterium]|nr:hypothetical protein [Candidatus Peribacteria bacterium]
LIQAFIRVNESYPQFLVAKLGGWYGVLILAAFAVACYRFTRPLGVFPTLGSSVLMFMSMACFLVAYDSTVMQFWNAIWDSSPVQLEMLFILGALGLSAAFNALAAADWSRSPEKDICPWAAKAHLN